MTKTHTMKTTQQKLSASQSAELLKILEHRFNKHTNRHKGISWEDVQARLIGKPEKLWSLEQMEASGGEPDVIAFDKKTGEFVFVDCAAESPKERRSLCYDGEALRSRKEHKPKSSALDVATDMGVDLLDEAQYRSLQDLGEFDLKTSSWLFTPAEQRKLGGALFGDRRYNRVFIYHNGAESYYAARGFRALLRV